MIQTVSGALEKFQNSVGIKFQLYNSLFLSLPFYGVDKTGILLSLFNTDGQVLGVPLLFAYIFSAWLLLIVTVALIVETPD